MVLHQLQLFGNPSFQVSVGTQTSWLFFIFIFCFVCVCVCVCLWWLDYCCRKNKTNKNWLLVLMTRTVSVSAVIFKPVWWRLPYYVCSEFGSSVPAIQFRKQNNLGIWIHTWFLYISSDIYIKKKKVLSVLSGLYTKLWIISRPELCDALEGHCISSVWMTKSY